MADLNPLQDVEAFLFDVFGTVVDWHGTVERETRRIAERHTGTSLGDFQVQVAGIDWSAFAKEWRQGYYESTALIANSASKPSPDDLNVDKMHRTILDAMLASPRWSELGSTFGEQDRQELTLVWHRLDAWPDTVEGLHGLKKHGIIATLSNGNVRLLLDMAKHAGLPWDTIFSGELLGSFKPNPLVYNGGAHHLSLPTSRCAMVAAHIRDLRAAASNGLKTVYVRRPTEDLSIDKEGIKAKKDGGEVDVVVSSFVELAALYASSKQ